MMEIITKKDKNGMGEVIVKSGHDYLSYIFKSRHAWVTKIGRVGGYTFKPDSREVSWIKVGVGALPCDVKERLEDMHNYFWSTL